MSRTKKKYSNGQSRGGSGIPASTTRTPKDYHRVAVQFHGGELAYEKFVKGGRRGYAVR